MLCNGVYHEGYSARNGYKAFEEGANDIQAEYEGLLSLISKS